MPAKKPATVKKTADQLAKSIKKAAPAAEKQPAKPPAPKLPKSLAACADLLYTTQQARFALNKEAEKLSAVETAIRERFINELPKSDSTGIAGKIARVKIESKTIVSVTDREALKKFADAQIKKDPANKDTWYKFTVPDKTIKEMWEAGKPVKGVERMHIPVVSLHKV